MMMVRGEPREEIGTVFALWKRKHILYFVTVLNHSCAEFMNIFFRDKKTATKGSSQLVLFTPEEQDEKRYLSGTYC